MNRYRFLGFSAYLVATTLIVVPFFDAAMSLWPWQPDSAQWRFGAIGLASNALMLPCAGMLIALATGITLGQPERCAGWGCSARPPHSQRACLFFFSRSTPCKPAPT